MKRRNRQHGFTLLELILVMLIACTALAIAAPSLTGWRHGSMLRNSAEDLLTLTRYARTQAITEAVVYRLNFDTSRNFWLTKADSSAALDKDGFKPFQTLGTDFGQKFTFPEGVLFTVTKAANANASQSTAPDSIDFYPTGRTQPAEILITDSALFSIQIKCAAPAENFKIVAEGQGLR